MSDCLKNVNREGRQFLERFGPDRHVACFTFHTLIELRRRADLFEKFVRTFSRIPWFLLKPWGQIDVEEASNASVSPLLNAFTPLGSNDSYDTQAFFERISHDPNLQAHENDWRSEEEFAVAILKRLAKDFVPEKPAANARDAERFLEFAKPHLLQRPQVSLTNRPAARIYLYSIYFRLYGKRDLPPQEFTDVRIAALAPYVDVFCTERFQAGVLERLRNRMPELADLEVVRLRDLRIDQPGSA